MIGITNNRVFSVLIAVVLVASLFAGAVGTVAAQDNTTTSTPTPTETPDGTQTEGNETTNTPTETVTNETAGSGDVEQTDNPARLFPVRQDQDWLTVEERDTAVYGTTGPSVIFRSLDEVQHVTVREPGANARLIASNVIMIEFDDNAAAAGEETLFTVDVLYADGTRGSAELYASQTNVEAGANDLQDYRGYLLSELDQAEKAGYERSPDGLQNYHDRLREIKEVFDSLFVEKAKQAVAWAIAGLTNPIVVLSGMLALLGLITWLLRRFSESIRILSEDPGRVARMRREITNNYQEDQRTAADTRLRDVTKIGRSGEIYWEDAFDVETLVELGELARGELPVRVRNGEIETMGGVAGISASNISESWLERVTRPDRLPSDDVAVAQMRAALHELITQHGLGHIYRDAYSECDRLLDELDEVHSSPNGEFTTGGAAAAAGGDD